MKPQNKKRETAPMLRFQNLSKHFGPKTVSRHAQAQLQPGAYALQGDNGSGKSTLLAMLAGAIEPDAGEIWIDGTSLTQEPAKARSLLSYAPDESPVYPFVTGQDFLDLVAQARRCAVAGDAMQLAEHMGLAQYWSTRFDAMSLGTQKKFLLCAAWIGQPRVMLLDEPSNGLDHAARDVLAQWIARHAAQRVVLFASHDAAFVQACGARVVQLGEWVVG
jgi:ABC-type multidrug transport system ATPase subunit